MKYLDFMVNATYYSILVLVDQINYLKFCSFAWSFNPKHPERKNQVSLVIGRVYFEQFSLEMNDQIQRAT